MLLFFIIPQDTPRLLEMEVIFISEKNMQSLLKIIRNQNDTKPKDLQQLPLIG